jgi:hypothetical protein
MQRTDSRSFTWCAWDPALVAGSKAVFHKSRKLLGTPSPSADCMMNGSGLAWHPMPAQRIFFGGTINGIGWLDQCYVANGA